MPLSVTTPPTVPLNTPTFNTPRFGSVVEVTMRSGQRRYSPNAQRKDTVRQQVQDALVTREEERRAAAAASQAEFDDQGQGLLFSTAKPEPPKAVRAHNFFHDGKHYILIDDAHGDHSTDFWNTYSTEHDERFGDNPVHSGAEFALQREIQTQFTREKVITRKMKVKVTPGTYSVVV